MSRAAFADAAAQLTLEYMLRPLGDVIDEQNESRCASLPRIERHIDSTISSVVLSVDLLVLVANVWTAVHYDKVENERAAKQGVLEHERTHDIVASHRAETDAPLSLTTAAAETSRTTKPELSRKRLDMSRARLDMLGAGGERGLFERLDASAFESSRAIWGSARGISSEASDYPTDIASDSRPSLPESPNSAPRSPPRGTRVQFVTDHPDWPEAGPRPHARRRTRAQLGCVS